VNKIVCIYKIVNPKGKVYVGQTIDYKKRMQQYSKGHCKPQRKLYNSFMKYGFQAHDMSIITLSTKENLDTLENGFITAFNCVENGLNLCSGGRYERVLSSESKKIMGEKMKGELNPNFGKSTWNKGIKQWANTPHPFLGKKLSEEHKKKVREGNAKIYAKGGDNWKSVRINQYTLDGQFIRIWLSSKCVYRELGIDSSSVIKNCKGKLKTCKGFIFKYDN
jgi:group I intron endonuclease